MDKLKYSYSEISTAIYGLADRLRNTMADDDTVMYACILKGGVVFFADLIRALPPGYTEYIAASSYDEEGRRGNLIVSSMPDGLDSPKYTKIYLIDDICDSGITLSVIASQLAARYPKAKIHTVALIQKAASPRPADFCAFVDDSEDFVFGYGMDRANGYARNCANIYVMNREGI